MAHQNQGFLDRHLHPGLVDLDHGTNHDEYDYLKLQHDLKCGKVYNFSPKNACLVANLKMSKNEGFFFEF